MKGMRWIVTILILALVLTACGGQMPAGTVVLPLDEMPGGFEGPNVEDNTGTSVMIQFTSGVPTVCNVAFGTDPYLWCSCHNAHDGRRNPGSCRYPDRPNAEHHLPLPSYSDR